MKCLLLGGGGFMGSHLSDALLSQGHSVRIFDRPNLKRFREYPDSSAVEWFDGDFLNNEDVTEALAGCDIVYHLVSTTLPKTSNDNPAYDIETNVIGTLHLLEQAKKTRRHKIIFVSSGGTVYGIPQEIPIKETHPTNPVCSYGIGKLTIEKYLHLYHFLFGLDYCVLRLSNPYGERQRVSGMQGAVAVFLNKAIKDETIDIWGDGSVTRDYIYIGDVMDALVRAISYCGSDRVFNVGGGQGFSLNDIIASLEALLGRAVQYRHMPSRPFDVPVNILDISKAREELLWEPTTTFDEGLRRTYAWMLRSAL
jgi:UDP-glucose 4-epimerase